MKIEKVFLIFLFLLILSLGFFFIGTEIKRTFSNDVFDKELMTYLDGVVLVSETDSNWESSYYPGEFDQLRLENEIVKERVINLDTQTFFRSHSQIIKQSRSFVGQGEPFENNLYSFLSANCENIRVFKSKDKVYVVAKRGNRTIILSASYVET